MAVTTTHAVTTVWRNGLNTLSGTISSSNDGEDNRDVTLTASQVQKEVAAAFTAAALLSVYILSTKDITLETNSTSVPDDTFEIAANVPFAWQVGTGIPNPFTATVTKLYLTNEEAAAADVQIRILKDSTP